MINPLYEGNVLTLNETNLNETKPKNYAVVLQNQPNTD